MFQGDAINGPVEENSAFQRQDTERVHEHESENKKIIFKFNYKQKCKELEQENSELKERLQRKKPPLSSQPSDPYALQSQVCYNLYVSCWKSIFNILKKKGFEPILLCASGCLGGCEERSS